VTRSPRSVVLTPITALAVGAALLLPATPAATAPPSTLTPSVAAARAATPGAIASGQVSAASPELAPPTLQVETVVDGLSIPWDLAFVGRKMLFTQRDAESLSVRLPDGEVRTLFEAPAGMWHQGETGLMGLAVDPDFGKNRTVYVCSGYDDGTTRDIRVTRWEIDRGFTAATPVDVVVSGIDITSGRHGGCRLRFAPNGALFIGTGDAAVGTNPQDLRSLNGKTLRVDARTGKPWPGNPFADAGNRNKRLVFTYGHRNVQGLAWRPGGGMWSAEHGTYRDDEVNKLKAGGNYGWNPVPGYDESKPMTDHSLPGRQLDARWSSGTPTIATSGMAWLRGDRWGDWAGRLVVPALAGERLMLLELDDRGRLVGEERVAELDGDYGRLRTAQLGPGKTLYLTTSNGGGNDVILKVTAQS
jgi:glucose/arabinose dehydrogenase